MRALLFTLPIIVELIYKQNKHTHIILPQSFLIKAILKTTKIGKPRALNILYVPFHKWHTVHMETLKLNLHFHLYSLQCWRGLQEGNWQFLQTFTFYLKLHYTMHWFLGMFVYQAYILHKYIYESVSMYNIIIVDTSEVLW